MTNSDRAVLVVVWAALAGAGCSPFEEPGSVLPQTCQREAPLVEPPKLDILFVIDSSNSMREEQEAVARELTAFVDQIRNGGGVRQDFHAGVITTSVYQNSVQVGLPLYRLYPEESGRLRPVPEPLPDGGVELDTANERYLSGEDPRVVEKFARLVRQGTVGSGQETPFEAVRLALSEPLVSTPTSLGGNLGFLRDQARLLVVVLTDEDDCSEVVRPPRVTVTDATAVAECTRSADLLFPVEDYHRLFTQLRNSDGSARDLVWTAIAPVSVAGKVAEEVMDGNQVRNVDCPTSNQAGFRHRRMAELFDASLANLDSICRPSFRETLLSIASLAAVAQVLDVGRVPDPNLLQVTITRQDGARQTCTLSNQGLVGATRNDEGGVRIQFGNHCRRRVDDSAVQVKLLCAT